MCMFGLSNDVGLFLRTLSSESSVLDFELDVFGIGMTEFCSRILLGIFTFALLNVLMMLLAAAAATALLVAG